MDRPDRISVNSRLAARYSLRLRLTVLIAALVVAVVGTLSWAAYSLVVRTLLTAGGERAQTAADQIAGFIEGPFGKARTDLGRLAAGAPLQQLATNPTPDAEEAARQYLNLIANSGPRRIEIWKATWLMTKDNPWVGVGFGGYWIAVPRYHDASGAYTPQQAHNDYLEILASGGLIGLAICLWLVVVTVKRLKDTGTAADPFRRAAWCGALVGLFGVAMHSSVDFGLHLTVNGALCAALVVIGTARIQAGERVSSSLRAP